MASIKGPGLYEFLMEAELQQYYSFLKNELKVQNVAQLKYVTDDDLYSIGFAKPEVRRLKKFFQRYYPQNYLHKFKKLILSKREENHDVVLPSSDNDVSDRQDLNHKYMIPIDNIVVNKELGQGEFGCVQQGVWTDEDQRIQVAIKCVSRDKMQNNPMEFYKEATLMCRLAHEHIVRLYGIVFEPESLMLVTELAPLRSLLECLKEPSLRSSFPVLILCDFAIQICDGMKYLEYKRLIHRDLAARNILVFSKNKVKISDFGLSRLLGRGKDYYQSNFNVNLKLPIAWCAPECISYLRFTSASDVWAFGVTLWEMFSYGFQPWAAMTGQQILEAIDEPNFQRLEQPECCPREYYALMLKCWTHDPNKRPLFAELFTQLPECKPEQVKAVVDYQEESSKCRRDQLSYRVNDVITVLDKPQGTNFWKGVTPNGKTGFFNPTDTVAYLGTNLPSAKSDLHRGDGRNTYSSRRRIRPDMISCPQGDVKHTGHVGLDGAYFGDVAFLPGATPSLPRQVVTPYKPHEDIGSAIDLSRGGSDMSDCTPLLMKPMPESQWAENNRVAMDHEYLEISDDDENPPGANGAWNGSPMFKKSFDFGPSLMDEMEPMLRGFGSPTPPPAPARDDRKKLPPPFQLPRGSSSTPPASPLAEAINVKNELKEIAAKVAGVKKKQATVKPLSATDQRTLDNAIALTHELTAKSLSDIDGGTPPESPHTPASPSKRKFSFRFPSVHRNPQRNDTRNFTEETACIPDIQTSIKPEQKKVYSDLVEQPSVFDTAVIVPTARSSVPIYGRQPLTCFSTFGHGTDTNPLRMIRAGVVPVSRTKPRTMSEPLRSPSTGDEDNPIPLPPRDRSKLSLENRPRHRRKHPLILPKTLDNLSPTDDSNDVFLPNTPEAKTPPALPVYNQAMKLPVCSDPDDIFEQQIATELDALDNLESPKAEHVSCEDLLAFSAQAQSKSRGVDSDEVRIMTKVLGKDTTAAACLAALDVTEWEMHRAIKLIKLCNVLKNANCHPDLLQCWSTLTASQGDVTRAAALLLNDETPPDFV